MPVGLPASRHRLAQILVAMGPERASEMMRQLPAERVQGLVADMATIDLTPEQAREVLKDLSSEVLQRQAAPAGLDLAKKVLTRLYGDDEAARLAASVDPRRVQPFAWLGQLAPAIVARALDDQPPATTAVALAHLEPGVSARILRRLTEPGRADVAMRMAALDTVAPDVVAAIDRSLRERLAARLDAGTQPVEGVGILAEVLTQSSPKLQKAIVESIRAHDDALAARIQERLFVFDDIVQLDDRAIQQVLKSIETMDLAFALHSSPDEIRQLIFRNLSERAREALEEEIDYLQNPKAAEIKAAKSRIVAVIRDLEESGAIEIERPGLEEDDEDDVDEEVG